MGKNEQRITIRNYAIPKEYYVEVKEYIAGYIKFLCEKILDGDFELNVFILKDKVQAHKAEVLVLDRKYRLNIYESLIVKLYRGEERFFCYSIMHEFCHIYDFQMAMDCKHTKARVSRSIGSTKKEDYIIKGFQFWGEVNAYEVNYEGFYKKDVDSPTTFQIMSRLKKIDEYADEIYRYKGNPPKKMYKILQEQVEQIAYDYSKYIAKRSLFGKKERYSKRTKSSQAYKDVKSFTKAVEAQIKIINKAPNGEDFDKNFGDLGKLLFEFFYEPLGFELTYINKKLALTCQL